VLACPSVIAAGRSRASANAKTPNRHRTIRPPLFFFETALTSFTLPLTSLRWARSAERATGLPLSSPDERREIGDELPPPRDESGHDKNLFRKTEEPIKFLNVQA